MPELTPDKRILEYLSKKGVGTYSIINHLLLDIFPDDDDFEDFRKANVHGAIWTFLAELRKHEFIIYRAEPDQRLGFFITATIQPKGIDYLHLRNRDNPTIISVSGSHNQVIGHSSESSNILRSVEKNPITQTINNNKDNTPKIRRNVELMSWIGGILLTIIGVWEFFIPLFKKDLHQEKTEQAQPKNVSKPQRHYEPADLVEVKKVSTDRNIKIEILYMMFSSESEIFSKELQTGLSKYYKQVVLGGSSSHFPNLNHRFSAIKIHNVIQIYVGYDLP